MSIEEHGSTAQCAMHEKGGFCPRTPITHTMEETSPATGLGRNPRRWYWCIEHADLYLPHPMHGMSGTAHHLWIDLRTGSTPVVEEESMPTAASSTAKPTSVPKVKYPGRDDLAKILDALPRPRRVLLYGPPGTGKTSISQLKLTATKGGATVRPYSVTLTAEGSAASLIGHFIPKGNEFVFHYGPAVRAWLEGRPLILNEIDHASEDASNVLHALLDDPGVAALTLPNGETVHPAKGFEVFATMNGVPADLALAIKDRLRTSIRVDRPGKEQLDRLDADVRTVCTALYAAAAKAGADSEPKVSYRAMLAFSDLRKVMPIEQAAALTLLTGPNPLERAQSFVEATILNTPVQ